MKLLGLLTVGKSLAAIKDRPRPLRLAEGLLPAFGPRTNVFALPDDPAAAPGAPRERVWRRGLAAIRRLLRWPRATVFKGETRLTPRLWNSSPPTPPAASTGQNDGTGERRSRRARRGQTPVQRELLLTAVQVVRNDLRDEDMEVELAQPSLFARRDGRLQLMPAAGAAAPSPWKLWKRRGTHPAAANP